MGQARIKSHSVEYDGINFDSELECDFYKYLKSLESNGKVADIIVHHPITLVEAFELEGVKHKAITYEPDFIFLDIANNKMRFVDIKGMETEVFKLKWKLFEFFTKTHLSLVCYDKETGWVEKSSLKDKKKTKRQKLIAEKNLYKKIFDIGCEISELESISNPNKRQLNRIETLKKKKQELVDSI